MTTAPRQRQLSARGIGQLRNAAASEWRAQQQIERTQPRGALAGGGVTDSMARKKRITVQQRRAQLHSAITAGEPQPRHLLAFLLHPPLHILPTFPFVPFRVVPMFDAPLASRFCQSGEMSCCFIC